MTDTNVFAPFPSQSHISVSCQGKLFSANYFFQYYVFCWLKGKNINKFYDLNGFKVINRLEQETKEVTVFFKISMMWLYCEAMRRVI